MILSSLFWRFFVTKQSFEHFGWFADNVQWRSLCLNCTLLVSSLFAAGWRLPFLFWFRWWLLLQACQSRGGPGGALTPIVFGRTVNPISTRGSRLCRPHSYILPPPPSLGFSDLPTALYSTTQMRCISFPFCPWNSFIKRSQNTNLCVYLTRIEKKNWEQI